MWTQLMKCAQVHINVIYPPQETQVNLRRGHWAVFQAEEVCKKRAHNSRRRSVSWLGNIGSGLFFRTVIPISTVRALGAWHNKCCYSLSWCFSTGVTRDLRPQRVRQREMHWAHGRENKFTLKLAGQQLISVQFARKEIYSYSKKYTKRLFISQVDFFWNSCSNSSSDEQKKLNLTWIFPPSSLTYKAQQVRLETALSAEHFWATKFYIETGVGWKNCEINFSKPFSGALGRCHSGKIYSPGKASLFSKGAKAFCTFNMHQINHSLWVAILASARCLTTWIIFTLVSLNICYLQVL